jgi:CRP/FNR family transcriptional regulator, cyclic AMP receptor protein
MPFVLFADGIEHKAKTSPIWREKWRDHIRSDRLSGGGELCTGEKFTLRAETRTVVAKQTPVSSSKLTFRCCRFFLIARRASAPCEMISRCIKKADFIKEMRFKSRQIKLGKWAVLESRWYNGGTQGLSHQTLAMKRLRPAKKRAADARYAGPEERQLAIQSLFKLFPVLAPGKLERLADAMTLLRFKRGDRVLDFKTSSDVLIVLKGAIAVDSHHDGRDQLLVTLLAPGEILGVSSLLPEMGQSVEGYAFTNGLAATIDSTKLLDILLGIELAAFKSAMKMTVGWAVETLIRYIRTFHLSTRDRLVIALIEMGAKFGVRDSRGLILNLPITQKDLASLLGASRQKINAHLRELARLGAVMVLGRQIVLVPEKLSGLIRDPEFRHQIFAKARFSSKPNELWTFPRREQMRL